VPARGSAPSAAFLVYTQQVVGQSVVVWTRDWRKSPNDRIAALFGKCVTALPNSGCSNTSLCLNLKRFWLNLK
jgi:hypothetical protein